MIKMTRGLRDGFDLVGHAIGNPPDMALGAVVNPNFTPLALQLLKMKKEVDAGAEFLSISSPWGKGSPSCPWDGRTS